MEVIINLKDKNKKQFLVELLKQFDFLDFKFKKEENKEVKDDYDFFESAGLFEDREIDATQLRQAA